MELSNEQFAEAVLDLYNRIRQNIPSERGVKIPDDVKALAFPLATLHEALDVLKDELVKSPQAGKIKRSQIIPALHLLDSLANGTEHEFWRFAAAMRASMRHRKSPGEVEILRRTMAVGLLRALMKVMGSRSESRAGRMIAAALMKRGGMKITASQLSEWNTHFQTARADDPEPDQCALRFSTDHGKPITDPNRILFNGIHNIDEFFGKANF